MGVNVIRFLVDMGESSGVSLRVAKSIQDSSHAKLNVYDHR